MRPEDLLARLEAGYAYDPMYGQLCNERDQLQDENAKLVMKLNAEHLVRQNVERENAKLRELLSIMAYCNQFRRDCDGCSMNGAAGIITERAGCDELLARLRELGVEV